MSDICSLTCEGRVFKRQPVYLRAQDAIKSYIERHRLGPGAPLPSEVALAQELGTSRASLREGIKSLEALGIVEVRRGEGLFVKAFSFDSIFNSLPYSFAVDGRSLRELTQVRGALEEGLMWMVAECIDEGTVQR
ncbi:GntR family transcriptional regulator, partial [Helicobacter pylori]|nr:GntR family transcriptional regulator [Helicobacter pylori]